MKQCTDVHTETPNTAPRPHEHFADNFEIADTAHCLINENSKTLSLQHNGVDRCVLAHKLLIILNFWQKIYTEFTPTIRGLILQKANKR